MNLAVAIAKAHEAVDLNNEARTELLTELARKPDDVGLHASLAQPKGNSIQPNKSAAA